MHKYVHNVCIILHNACITETLIVTYGTAAAAPPVVLGTKFEAGEPQLHCEGAKLTTGRKSLGRSHHASSPHNAGGTHDMHTHIHHRHTPSSPGQEGGTTRDNTPNRSGHMLLRDRPLLRPRDDIVEPQVERLSPASAPRVIVPSGRTLGPSCFNTWVKGVDA